MCLVCWLIKRLRTTLQNCHLFFLCVLLLPKRPVSLANQWKNIAYVFIWLKIISKGVMQLQSCLIIVAATLGLSSSGSIKQRNTNISISAAYKLLDTVSLTTLSYSVQHTLNISEGKKNCATHSLIRNHALS